MCNEAFEEEPYTLEFVLDQYIMQEISNEIMRINLAVLYLVPDHFKIQEMCIKALKVGTWRVLEDVPDCFKTHEMCDKTVGKCPFSLLYAPD